MLSSCCSPPIRKVRKACCFSQGKLNESEFSQLRQDYKQQLLQQPAEQVKAGAGQPKIKITRKKATSNWSNRV